MSQLDCSVLKVSVVWCFLCSMLAISKLASVISLANAGKRWPLFWLSLCVSLFERVRT